MCISKTHKYITYICLRVQAYTYTIHIYAYIIYTYICSCVQLLQSCPILRDTTGYSPPGSSVLQILQAKIMK